MLVNDLQHRGDHPAQLPVISAIAALASQHVELIEYEHPGSHVQETEDLFQIACCLAQIGGDDRRQPDPRDGNPEFSGHCLGAGGLAAAWRADQQQTRPWRNPMRPQRRSLTELLDERVEDRDGRVRQNQVLKRQPRLLQRNQREVVASLGERPQRRDLQRPRALPGLLQDRRQLIRDQIVALAPLLVDEFLGGAPEPGVVTPLVAVEESLHQVTSRHSANLLGACDGPRLAATAPPGGPRRLAARRRMSVGTSGSWGLAAWACITSA